MSLLRLTFRQLEYLVAVGEAGSIALAAKRVNVSSPSISASIAQLEQEFGIELFVRRHSHGLSLTTGGRRFFDHAKRILEDAESLHELATDIAEKVRGPLGVGCLLTFAQFVLPELRREFETLYPEVLVRQTEANQEQLINRLLRAEIDVALTYDLGLGEEIGFEPLVTLPPYVMLPAGHKLASQAVLTPAQLIDEKMVLLDLPFSRDYFLSLFREAGLRPKIGERTADMAVMRSMVANGFGYALANVRPKSGISPDGKPLCFVPLDGDQRPMIMGLATPAAGRKTRTVQAFVDHCKTLITDEHVPGLAPMIPVNESRSNSL